jgi:methylglutamate dehydrogenase subunit B
MLIPCPFCGEREAFEFEFRCSVHERGATAAERLYLRFGDPQRSVEHWQHVHGCRLWLELHRDLLTGRVLRTSSLPSSPAEGVGS